MNELNAYREASTAPRYVCLICCRSFSPTPAICPCRDAPMTSLEGPGALQALREGVHDMQKPMPDSDDQQRWVFRGVVLFGVVVTTALFMPWWMGLAYGCGLFGLFFVTHNARPDGNSYSREFLAFDASNASAAEIADLMRRERLLPNADEVTRRLEPVNKHGWN